jgi:addiction module HigA family antidote
MLERIRTVLSFLDAASNIERWISRVFDYILSKAGCGDYGRLPFAQTGASYLILRTATPRTWTSWTIIEATEMTMKNPAHPGSLVKDNIEELGLSVADAAKGLGVTRQQLYKVIKSESSISPEMAVRLEKAFGGSADTWLRMQMNYDLARARERDIKVSRMEPKAA